MPTNSVKLRQATFVQEQKQKIAQERGRLGALKNGRHNAGFDLEIDAGILQELCRFNSPAVSA